MIMIIMIMIIMLLLLVASLSSSLSSSPLFNIYGAVRHQRYPYIAVRLEVVASSIKQCLLCPLALRQSLNLTS